MRCVVCENKCPVRFALALTFVLLAPIYIIIIAIVVVVVAVSELMLISIAR